MRDRERERGSGSPDREENKEREKTDVGGNGKTDRETAVEQREIPLINQLICE